MMRWECCWTGSRAPLPNKIQHPLQNSQDRLNEKLVQQGSQWVVHFRSSSNPSPRNASVSTGSPELEFAAFRAGVAFLQPHQPAVGYCQFPTRSYRLHFGSLRALQSCIHEASSRIDSASSSSLEYPVASSTLAHWFEQASSPTGEE